MKISTYPHGETPSIIAPEPYIISFELWSGVPAREDLYHIIAAIAVDLFQASEWITVVEVTVGIQVQPPETYRINPDVASTEVFAFHRSQLAQVESAGEVAVLRSLSDSAKARINKDRLYAGES